MTVTPEAAALCNAATWQRMRRFHELTFFFIPIARWGRQQLESCPICGETEQHSDTKPAATVGRPQHAGPSP